MVRVGFMTASCGVVWMRATARGCGPPGRGLVPPSRPAGGFTTRNGPRNRPRKPLAPGRAGDRRWARARIARPQRGWARLAGQLGWRGVAGPAYCVGEGRACAGPVAAGRAVRGAGVMADQQALSFAGLLRQLRAEARLTQEELAQAAGVGTRSVSDLERGIHATAHKDTAGLLAGALGLAGPVRTLFIAAARGKAPAAEVLTARQTQTPGAFAAAATRALPRDLAAFTGRQAELALLIGGIDALAANGGVVGIHAIDGMAGIGKTTFAVHAAHQLAPAFPDGQFFLPLHAHTAGQRPVDPADALASLLLTAGVPAAQIPPGVDARAGRWRDQVAGKKILLVLDDAAGHEQVRPLLPGTAGSLVLVTSRRRLTALDDAAVITWTRCRPRRRSPCWPGWRPGPGSVPRTPPWVNSPGWADTCRWRSGCSPASWPTTPPGPPRAWPLTWPPPGTGWSRMRAENLSVAAAFGLSYQDLTAGPAAAVPTARA